MTLLRLCMGWQTAGIPRRVRVMGRQTHQTQRGACQINPRLVNLLGSFIGGTSAYALARLELALTFPNHRAPPVIDRLPDASERTLREQWDRIENQLHGVVDYVKAVESDPRSSQRSAASFAWLKRTVRELDQYARAMRWVLTVSEPYRAEDHFD